MEILQKIQGINEAVDISSWIPDADFPTYPEGTRSKKAVICPDNIDYSFLIPSHRYLFKKSNERYPEQFWVEIIAYLVGCKMGIKVPPAFVSYDSRNNRCGALIEWFYGYPREAITTRFLKGGDFMTAMIPHYDREKGMQHNFGHVERISRIFIRKGYLREKWFDYWCQVFLFDAIIGNTDRHQDNWGFIVYGATPPFQFIFSPAFDNGTAMGHEILQSNFIKFEDPDYIARYVSKGTHHMKWRINSLRKLQFADMILKLLEKHSQLRTQMIEALNFNINELMDEIMELTKFDIPVPLSEARASFVSMLIQYRYRQLIDKIGL